MAQTVINVTRGYQLRVIGLSRVHFVFICAKQGRSSARSRFGCSKGCWAVVS